MIPTGALPSTRAAALRRVAELIEQGHPADYVGVGDAVTVVANAASAARWMATCPNGLLPGTTHEVVVQVIPTVAVA